MTENRSDIEKGEALGDDLAPALDDVPENADEQVGEEVEGDFDPEVDYEPEVEEDDE